MSGLSVTTAVLPSLSSGSAGDLSKSSAGANAAFTGVLNRVATPPIVADPKSQKESVGQAFSGKRARSDAGSSGSDEPDTETLDQTPPESTAALAGPAPLDISALVQAAMIATGPAVPQAAKTQAARSHAISEAGPAEAVVSTHPTESATAAALQAIVQQPGRSASAGGAINQGIGSLPSQPAGADGRTSLQPAAALAPMAGASAGPAASSAVAPRIPEMVTGPTAPAVPSQAASGTDVKSTAGGAPQSSQASTDAAQVAAVAATPQALQSAATLEAPAPAASTVRPAAQTGTKPGTAPAVPSGTDVKSTAGGEPQSSQASTDAAQVAAVAATPQVLQSAVTLETPAPAASAVRPAAQTGTKPSAAAPLRTGTIGSAKSPTPETTATASASSLDAVTGKRGKDKTPATTVVAAASTDTSVVATPVQQLVTALQSLGKDVVAPPARRPAGATTASADVSTPQSTGPSTLKTLTINLNPGHLGPVSITMRLQADTMEIRIAVSNPDTLHLLDKDKHLLAAAVEAMGGSRENLQVGTLVQTSGSGDPASTGGQNQNSPGRQDAASSDSSSNGRQAQGQNRSTLQDTSQSDADESTPTLPLQHARGLDGSLYL